MKVGGGGRAVKIFGSWTLCSPDLVVLSDTEDGDDISPPVGCSRRDPLHLEVAEVLDRMWHEVPATIPPIPIPGLKGHTEATTYYCGSRIHYCWHDEISQLILMDGNYNRTFPVDQDFVRVFCEGGHLAFRVAEPEETLVWSENVPRCLPWRPQKISGSRQIKHSLRK